MVESDNLCIIENCENKAEIKKKCKYHYWLDVKAKSKKIKKKATKIKSISENGYKRNLKYRTSRKEYLENHVCCEAKLPGCICPTIEYDNSVLQIHHKRGRIGEDLFDKTHFLAVCPKCHAEIEMTPLMSKLNGWSVSRLELTNK